MMDERLKAFAKDMQNMSEQLKNPVYLMVKAYWSVFDGMIICYRKHFPEKTLSQARAEMEAMLGVTQDDWVNKKIDEFFAMFMVRRGEAKSH